MNPRQLSQMASELINWGIPVLVMAVAVFLFGLPLWFALILALLVFGGLFFILNPKSAREESREQMRNEVADTLTDTHNKLQIIRYYGRDVTDKSKLKVRDRIMTICDQADTVINDLKANPDTELATASRLNSTFAQTAEIIKLYSELVNNKVAVPPEKRDELIAKIENDVLTQIETSLYEFARKLDQGEIVNLEAAIRVLEGNLKAEGLS